MSEMVKRVARAIEDKHDHGIDSVYEMLGSDTAVDLARAAIEAMREPTDAMTSAVDHECDSRGENYPERVKDEDAYIVWQQMIAAALKD